MAVLQSQNEWQFDHIMEQVVNVTVSKRPTFSFLFQSPDSLICAMKKFLAGNDSTRAAVAMTFNIVAKLDTIRGCMCKSCVNSTFRCEVIRRFASDIGIWESCDGSCVPPQPMSSRIGCSPLHDDLYIHLITMPNRHRSVEVIMAMLPESCDHSHTSGPRSYLRSDSIYHL
jgi:hypothetical protein